MSREAIKGVIDTYSELLRVHQLNIELLNTLEQALLYVQDFCQKRNIPFYDEKLSLILSKTDNLLDEIGNDSSPNVLCKKLADESLQRKRTDEDLTESCFLHVMKLILTPSWFTSLCASCTRQK
jgi:hypothetical protein